jgi:hypothetical protein
MIRSRDPVRTRSGMRQQHGDPAAVSPAPRFGQLARRLEVAVLQALDQVQDVGRHRPVPSKASACQRLWPAADPRPPSRHRRGSPVDPHRARQPRRDDREGHRGAREAGDGALTTPSASGRDRRPAGPLSSRQHGRQCRQQPTPRQAGSASTAGRFSIGRSARR